MSQNQVIQDKQPVALWLVFLTEMWERFSYYAMRSILILYMVYLLQMDKTGAANIYGTFTSLVYLSTLLGGFLADRYLGQRWSIILGSVLIASGMFVMSVPTMGMLQLAMGLLILGNGFFKPNVTAIVGQLYEKDDPRRDGGFTIFYMSVNIGAFFGPLAVGYFAAQNNYKAAFWIAGIGMLIGLGTFLFGQKKYLAGKGLPPAEKPVFYKDSALWAVFLGACVIALYMKGCHTAAWICGAVLVLGYAAYMKMRKQPETKNQAPLTTEEKHKIAVIAIMAFFTIFFWAAFEQAGAALNLFAYEYTNRVITLGSWSWEIPANWFQSLNPLYIVIFAPLFSKLWINLAKKGKEPSTPAKFRQCQNQPVLSGVYLPVPHIRRAVHFTGGQKHGDQAGSSALCVAVNGRVVSIQCGGQQTGRRVFGLLPENQQCAVFPVAGGGAALMLKRTSGLRSYCVRICVQFAISSGICAACINGHRIFAAEICTQSSTVFIFSLTHNFVTVVKTLQSIIIRQCIRSYTNSSSLSSPITGTRKGNFKTISWRGVITAFREIVGTGCTFGSNVQPFIVRCITVDLQVFSLLRTGNAAQQAHRFRHAAAFHRFEILRHGHRGQNTQNEHHYQQLNQGEAFFIIFHVNLLGSAKPCVRAEEGNCRRFLKTFSGPLQKMYQKKKTSQGGTVLPKQTAQSNRVHQKRVLYLFRYKGYRAETA